MICDCFRRLDSNKLQYLPNNCLNKIPKLLKIKLDKNPWHCDCHSVYLARFLREHFAKLWNGIAGGPICLGPGKWDFHAQLAVNDVVFSRLGELGGKQVKLTFSVMNFNVDFVKIFSTFPCRRSVCCGSTIFATANGTPWWICRRDCPSNTKFPTWWKQPKRCETKSMNGKATLNCLKDEIVWWPRNQILK